LADKLALPNVTLVMIETLCHALAKLSLEDCLAQAEFGEVLVFADQFNELRIPGASHHRVPNWSSKVGWSEFSWHGVPRCVRTLHALFIQWDSWIIDCGMWRGNFLRYDYIGAPWWYADGRNVGNGGFSLRSKRLMDFLRKHRERFPVTTSADDDLLCRGYRRALEAEAALHWAPEQVALDFAFERIRPSHQSQHFGFHGTFNWPFVLDADRLQERIELALRSDYIRNCGMLRELTAAQNAAFPWLKPHWQAAA
jgi:Protein of unknown function (DUF5672)